MAWAIYLLLDSWIASLVLLALAGGLALLADRLSDWLALAALGAREATPAEQQLLVNVVEEMAIAAQLPCPRIVVVDDDSPNAFAVGTGPRAAVGATTGLLARMDRDELQGVMAHEIAHIAGEDTRVMTTAFVLASVLTMAAQGLWRMRILGARRRPRGEGAGWQQAAAVAVLIIAPLAAKLLQMAVSREREYLADAEAARFTRNPAGLARALRKLAEGPPVRRDSAATAHLYIHSPLIDERWAKLFSTHPPIQERILRLEAM